MADRITLKHVRSFVAVAQARSFTVAAAHLSVTQSALTATIQQFEEAVGQRMFDRSTRRVNLTRPAEIFLPEALRAIGTFDSAIGDLLALSAGDAGHIRIAAAASVIRHFLARSIEDFRRDYPQIKISLRDAAAPVVERLVIEGEVDFGLESGYDRIDGLEYTPLVIDRYGLVCRSDLPLARGKGPLRWSQLPQAGYVGFSADTGIGRFLRRHAGHWPVLAQPHDEVTSTTSLFALLSNGPRYSVVPAMALRDDEFPHLAYRQLSDPPLSREICLITRRLRALSPNAERLLDAIRTSVQLAKLPRGAKVAEGFKPPARRR